MKLMSIYEDVMKKNVFYHGTREWLPFEEFNPRMEGTGVVSTGGKKYGGFFFTSDKENAEYFGEYLIAKIHIREYEINNSSTHPPTTMRQAKDDKKVYVLEDVFDGGKYSDIAVVPMSEINKVKIIEWQLTEGAEEYWIEILNEKFTTIEYGWDDDAEEETDEEIESPPSQESVQSLLFQIGDIFDYVIKFAPFKKWYDSLPEG